MNVNNTTKNGYAISMIDAFEAPRLLIPENIRKFASAAKMTERMINVIFAEPECITAFIDPLLKNINGNITIIVINELINNSVIGEIPIRIL